ncbi:MAG TPA: TIR domain-containing protein [Syntrophobacteraceae bacterium]|nr:TIR domain-containing protein [Syntrophobacteraceae bacterium]
MVAYKYEVALSFAGEDRAFAEEVAKGLRDAGVQVFYDNFYAAELWGEEPSTKLRQVYHDSSEFCIMVISRYYLEKMWTIFERQQAIERLIREKGKAYVLHVRLDGFAGEVPGLPGSISYLSVRSNQAQIIVNTFLAKIGRNKPKASTSPARAETPKPYVPKLKRSFTDREKNSFLKDSFGEIIDLVERFLSDTKNEHPHFDYDAERITTRKAVFTVYSNQKQVTQIKIWLRGALGGNEISFRYGNRIEIDDNSSNESIYLEEREGELKLKPLGMGMFGLERDKLLSPREIAEYLWGIVCRSFS